MPTLPPTNDGRPVDVRWWDKTKAELPDALFSVARFIARAQDPRRHDDIRHMRLYGGGDSMGWAPTIYGYMMNRHAQEMFSVGLRLNICRSMVDTVVAKITSNRPKPMFLTSGGDFHMQQKAKKLDQFCEGLFYQAHAYDLGFKTFLDAGVMGTGLTKVYENPREPGRICLDRCFTGEIIVDELDGMYGEPRQLMQRKFVAREVLQEEFGDLEEIKESPINTEGLESFRSIAEMVPVLEAWHLPSAKGAKDGRHVISIQGRILFDEQWEFDYFPFVRLNWADRQLGFWGQGLVEQLKGIQLEVNRTLQTIAQSLHLSAIPRVLIEKGAKINKQHLNNEIGAIIEYHGTPPQFWVQDVFPPQLFEHLQYLVGQGYQIAGISQLQAQGVKPPGVNAAVAMRELKDTQSERFSWLSTAYDNYFLDLAKQCINLARRIYERDGKHEVVVPGSRFTSTVDWGDIDLDEDEYVMKVWPTNLLPSSPAGKLESAQELIQGGLLSKDQAMELLTGIPDLESVTSLVNAPIENIKATIDAIITDGKYTPPEPYQPLQMGINMMQSAYLKAKNDNVPEARLELMRRWMDQADTMLNPPQPAAPMAPQPAGPAGPPGPPMPPVGGPPTGVAAPPPVSQLIPNVPKAA